MGYSNHYIGVSNLGIFFSISKRLSLTFISAKLISHTIGLKIFLADKPQLLLNTTVRPSITPMKANMYWSNLVLTKWVITTGEDKVIELQVPVGFPFQWNVKYSQVSESAWGHRPETWKKTVRGWKRWPQNGENALLFWKHGLGSDWRFCCKNLNTDVARTSGPEVDTAA